MTTFGCLYASASVVAAGAGLIRFVGTGSPLWLLLCVPLVLFIVIVAAALSEAP